MELEVTLNQLAHQTQIATSATSDDQFIATWLSLKHSQHTRRAYERVVDLLLDYLEEMPADIRSAKIETVAGFLELPRFDADSPGTKAQRCAIVKSLFSFGQKTGYIGFNVAAAIPPPKQQNRKTERLMSEGDVVRLIDAAGSAKGQNAKNDRNRLIVRLLYMAGLRVSEVSNLKWKHIMDRDNNALQLTVHGKGGKTRHVLLPANFAEALRAWRGAGLEDEFVFQSNSGGRLSERSIQAMVKSAAERTNFGKPVSPHWLRHAHASHALDRGATLAVVQETLGHSDISTTGAYLHAKPGDGSAMYLPEA